MKKGSIALPGQQLRGVWILCFTNETAYRDIVSCCGHLYRYWVKGLSGQTPPSDQAYQLYAHCCLSSGCSLLWKSEGESFTPSGRAQMWHLKQQWRSRTFMFPLRACLGRSEPDKITSVRLESPVSSCTQVEVMQRRWRKSRIHVLGESASRMQTLH